MRTSARTGPVHNSLASGPGSAAGQTGWERSGHFEPGEQREEEGRRDQIEALVYMARVTGIVLVIGLGGMLLGAIVAVWRAHP